MAAAPPERGRAGGDAGALGFFKARVWQGMPLSVWLPLLARNRFAVSPARIPQALRMTLFAIFNSLLHRTDQLVYGRRVARAALAQPPLFIIGHWRTGTTLLHELLVHDDQFSYPTTYQCMAPFHFLLTEGLIPRFLPHLLPSQRPMDNMRMGFSKPQEDEIALCGLGVPSPYLRWAFANRDCGYDHYLELEGLTPRELERWTAALTGFLRRLAFRDPRRLVLKSPTHTARVRHLINVFPGAQFVHIVRDPFVVFASTVHTWKQLWNSMGYQTPSYEGIDDYVLDTFVRMYHAFERDRPLLDARHLVEVRYEELVRDAPATIERIYVQLGIEGFERVRPKIAEHMARSKDYRTNQLELPERLRQAIAERWRGYLERYGYQPPTSPGA